MSTAPSSVATVKESLGQKIAADLGKVGHAFVIGAEKLKAAVIAVENGIKKAQPDIAIGESIANTVAEEIYPGAGTVASAIELAMSKVFTAVDAVGDATAADTLNVQLDSAAIAAVKAALPTVKAQAQTTPGS